MVDTLPNLSCVTGGKRYAQPFNEAVPASLARRTKCITCLQTKSHEVVARDVSRFTRSLPKATINKGLCRRVASDIPAALSDSTIVGRCFGD